MLQLRRRATTKQFYSDHVAHAAKMFQLMPRDATEATINDIDSFAAALNDMTPTDANLIIDIYADGNFPAAVKIAAKRYNLRESFVWATLDDFGRKFARLRGLI